MKKSPGVGVGSTTMLIIFVSLCLCTFATLSFVSSKADYRLSKDAADALTAYYAADDRAIEKLHKIEASLKTLPSSDSSDYQLRQCEKLLLSTGICQPLEGSSLVFTFTEPVDSNRELMVQFKLTLPTSHNDRYTLPQKWQIQPLQETGMIIEEPLTLWNGENNL